MAAVSERGRGQLILVGALTMAVSFVAIALILNSAIYTHNLASRYDSPGDEAVTFARDARIAAGGALDGANEHHARDGYSTVRSAYLDGVGAVETGMADGVAVDGRVARVEHVSDSAERGVWIADKADGGSTFEPATATIVNWTVASDVRVRQYDMRVDGTALQSMTSSEAEDFLADLAATPQGFVVEFDDGTDVWRVIVYDDGGINVMVHEDGSGTFETCATSATEATIEFTDATVAGEPCQPLSFLEGLTGPYTVRYYRGDLAAGRYELTADRTVDAASSSVGPFTDVVDDANYAEDCDGPTYHGAASGEHPMVAPVVFQSAIQVTYDGPDVTYQGTRTVAPELPGGGIEHPRTTTFDVTDSSSLVTEFEVDWTVTDPNADLDTVELVLANESTGTIEDSATIDVSGESASGTTTLSMTSLVVGTFDVRITVTDGAGNARTVEQTHRSDDDGSGCPP